MAMVKVSAGLIADVLFEGAEPAGVAIVGARFDAEHNLLELQIEGPGVPDVARVQCIVRQERRTCSFEPVA